jgi:hypothetical protein
MLLLAFGQPEFDLGKAPFGEVDAEWNNREPLLLRLGEELMNLLAMKEQFPSAERLVIHDVAVTVRTDVAMVEKCLAALHTGVTILEVHTPFSQGLDFRTLKDNSCFELLFNEIVVVGLAIRGHRFFTLFFLLLDHRAASPLQCERHHVQKSSGLRRLLP